MSSHSQPPKWLLNSICFTGTEGWNCEMLCKKLTCLFLNWWESPTHPRKLNQLKVILWFALHSGWSLGYQVGYDMFLNGFFYKLILWSLLPSPACPERTWPSQNQKWHILWIWKPITRTTLWRLLPLDRMNFNYSPSKKQLDIYWDTLKTKAKNMWKKDEIKNKNQNNENLINL